MIILSFLCEYKKSKTIYKFISCSMTNYKKEKKWAYKKMKKTFVGTIFFNYNI